MKTDRNLMNPVSLSRLLSAVKVQHLVSISQVRNLLGGLELLHVLEGHAVYAFHLKKQGVNTRNCLFLHS